MRKCCVLKNISSNRNRKCLSHNFPTYLVFITALVFITEIITVTAIFLRKMEVTFVVLLLLTLGAANADDESICTRIVGDQEQEIFECTKCLWMSETCKFCDDNHPGNILKTSLD